MIIETIFSTIDEQGLPNFAPMGVEWGDEFLTVRPYRNTHTYCNLRRHGYGVANLTENVLAYVRCGLYGEVLPCFPAKTVPGVVFEGTCSWRELKVISGDGSDQRAEFQCRVLYTGKQRDFLGFCRAAGAVIEAAILATRLTLCDPKEIEERIRYCWNIVHKTGADNEKRAMQLIDQYVRMRGSHDRG